MPRRNDPSPRPSGHSPFHVPVQVIVPRAHVGSALDEDRPRVPRVSAHARQVVEGPPALGEPPGEGDERPGSSALQSQRPDQHLDVSQVGARHRRRRGPPPEQFDQDRPRPDAPRPVAQDAHDEEPPRVAPDLGTLLEERVGRQRSGPLTGRHAPHLVPLRAPARSRRSSQDTGPTCPTSDSTVDPEGLTAAGTTGILNRDGNPSPNPAVRVGS